MRKLSKVSLVLAVLSLMFASCMDNQKRLATVKKYYPGCIVGPATSLIANQGYEFMVEDTANNQIYAVKFYAFSETKISDVRNIK